MKTIVNNFNVIIYNVNAKKFESFDVIPYLVDCYFQKWTKPKPKTFEEWKKFVMRNSMNRFWARCEYEIILSEWPPCDNKREEKWDVHQQVMMNIDTITNIVIDTVKQEKIKRKVEKTSENN